MATAEQRYLAGQKAQPPLTDDPHVLGTTFYVYCTQLPTDGTGWTNGKVLLGHLENETVADSSAKSFLHGYQELRTEIPELWHPSVTQMRLKIVSACPKAVNAPGATRKNSSKGS